VPLGGGVEQVGGILELLVFQELADQLGPRVAGALLIRLLGFLPRQEHGRLDLHQRGGHDQEIARQIDVESLEDLDVLQVLVGDLGDGDIVDIHLFLADEIEQQIERAGEDVEVDAVISQRSLLPGLVVPVLVLRELGTLVGLLLPGGFEDFLRLLGLALGAFATGYRWRRARRNRRCPRSGPSRTP
jgi:hypothetical protein